MIKYIGLAVLFLIIIYIGQIIAGVYKSSVKEIDFFINFIKYIKSQIEFYNTTYPDIYKKYPNDVCRFIEKLRTNDWKSAINNTYFHFDNNVKELLLNFGNDIGRSLREDQISNCNYTIEQLENHYKNYKSELPKKIKLCTSLSMMAGLSIVIIFI